MDEKLVEQVSSTSGIPQMLVSRSAQARAEASGVSVNDVLNSWTGGEAIQAAPANETVPESQVVVEEAPTPVDEQVDEPIEVVEPENLVEPIQTSVLIKEDLPPPVSISQKLLRSLKFGSKNFLTFNELSIPRKLVDREIIMTKDTASYSAINFCVSASSISPS